MKKIILIMSTFLSLMALSGCGKIDVSSSSSNQVFERNEVKNSEEAIDLLKKGNERFVNNSLLNDNFSQEKKEDLLSNGQHPYAVILSCSDSRVPPELIFDQGLGDLFIIRNAGNVLDEVTLGSVEYGAEHLNIPLIVVLGHENCGAVKAAVESKDEDKLEGNIASIVEKIKVPLKEVNNSSIEENELCKLCEDENIKNSVKIIKDDPIIKELEEKGVTKVIGAKYDLDTGKVIFD
jgi:carbonic anhydrase